METRSNKLHGSSHSDPRIDYAAKHSLRMHPVLEKLAKKTQEHPLKKQMGSLDELQLLQNIVRSIGAKRTLEIGVYTGISALFVALGLPNDGEIIACDITDEYVKIGLPYWKEAGVDHKIKFVNGPAINTLKNLLDAGEAEKFDFALIDADKGSCDAYYELCLKLVRPKGIVAIDNTFWNGRVLDPDFNTHCTISTRKLNEKIFKDDRVYVSFLTIGEGTTLCFKK